VTYHIDGTVTLSDSAMFGGSHVSDEGLAAVWRVGTDQSASLRWHDHWARLRSSHQSAVGFLRSRTALEISIDRNRLQGSMVLDVVFCSTATMCPDPTDPGLTWFLPTPFPVSASRVLRLALS
jgi:hypothetical protein